MNKDLYWQIQTKDNKTKKMIYKLMNISEQFLYDYFHYSTFAKLNPSNKVWLSHYVENGEIKTIKEVTR